MTSSTMPSIECALSGVVPDAEVVEDAALLPPDNATGLPIGWTQITVVRRRLNPAWEAIQEVKDLTIRNLLFSTDPETREDIAPAVALQVEAQFAALEARPEYALTLLERAVVHIAPAEEVEGMSEEIRRLADMLGIDPDLLLAREEEEEEEEEEEAEEVNETKEDTPVVEERAVAAG